MKHKLKSYTSKFFTDKNGKVVLWQSPNLPLWGWFVSMVLSKILRAGGLHSAFKYMSVAFLIVWAVLEITKGASYFRRALGFVIFAWIIISHL